MIVTRSNLSWMGWLILWLLIVSFGPDQKDETFYLYRDLEGLIVKQWDHLYKVEGLSELAFDSSLFINGPT